MANLIKPVEFDELGIWSVSDGEDNCIVGWSMDGCWNVVGLFEFDGALIWAAIAAAHRFDSCNCNSCQTASEIFYGFYYTY